MQTLFDDEYYGDEGDVGAKPEFGDYDLGNYGTKGGRGLENRC